MNGLQFTQTQHECTFLVVWNFYKLIIFIPSKIVVGAPKTTNLFSTQKNNILSFLVNYGFDHYSCSHTFSGLCENVEFGKRIQLFHSQRNGETKFCCQLDMRLVCAISVQYQSNYLCAILVHHQILMGHIT